MVAAIHSPVKAAAVWLSTVATRIPSTIGSGFRKCEASSNASSCVLSPTSEIATTPVEVRSAYMRFMGAGERQTNGAVSPRLAQADGHGAKGLAMRVEPTYRPRHAETGKHVGATPS